MAVREALQYRDLIRNLTQRELRSRYRRSFLGWGWSLLQPALMTAVYSIVLGVIFKVPRDPGDPSGIDSFPIFLLAGVLMWNFLAAGLNGSMGSISNAGNLLTRVWFPREVLPISAILAMALSLLIELGILSVTVVIITGKVMFHLLPVALFLVALLVLFVAGLSFWLAACNAKYRDVEYLTSVVLLAYFYLTPVLYPPSLVPDTAIGSTGLTLRDLSLANPMARFAMAFRNVFYDIRLPGFETTMWLVGWSLASFYFGLRFFVRRADRFAELI
jgi:lipopolysaccharide transport system permease protein